MFAVLIRFRVLISRVLSRAGFGPDAFLILLAVLIALITALLAVAFHELIGLIRWSLFERIGPAADLYDEGLALLAVFPALGGLAVGLIARYVIRQREGHGIIDVMEAVIRARGVIHPKIALEKIFTSALTIGTGGSTGAEGPIVQIGAAVGSGFGQALGISTQSMPLLIGCGSAAGISAIFNAPIGGVLFTLEVILQDFSIRTFTPVVVASVIANVATAGIFHLVDGAHGDYPGIFQMPGGIAPAAALDWVGVAHFVLLGLCCGVIGAILTRVMNRVEKLFGKWRWYGPLKPAVGGAMVGLMGIGFVLLMGRWMMGQPKPFDYSYYPLPAFMGDGYGVIRRLLAPDFYHHLSTMHILVLLGVLCAAKIVATAITLGSGGSGGIIAPSLMLGAAAGAMMAVMLTAAGETGIQPQVYALIGMGAALAAVVHAPLASILIVFELCRDDKIILPAMLGCVFATISSRLLSRDTVYSQGLRRRGVSIGSMADLTLLRRMSVEQVSLEPAHVADENQPLSELLVNLHSNPSGNVVVVNAEGQCKGLVIEQDINAARIDREAIPLLLVRDLLRTDLPMVSTHDDLAMVMDLFARHDVDHLPVCLQTRPGKVIGQISRQALMKKYLSALEQKS